jgi:hypothetical protein
MTRVTEWQPLFTAYGSDTYDLIQHESRWLNTGNCHHVILYVHVLSTGGSLTLYIETSESLEGPWNNVDSFGSFGAQPEKLVLSRDLPQSDTNRLRRYVRWRLSDDAYEICFRIRAQLS